ncbi:MAG: PH domain-containing protein [Betaproteobacteria bacterium]|nr:PH domain-containing protein [Betaproteobacteria bacterium]
MEYEMGNYVNSSLIQDEHVVYEAKNHWIIFISISSFLTLFIAPLIENWTSEFAVTNKRVVIKLGLISRKTLEMNLSKIESVNVDQSILGRLLGYGAITIIGTGGTRETFTDIADPMKFRRTFQECVDAH